MPTDFSQLPDDPVFNQALAKLWPDEGGFVDDPDDPGGATNLGITLYTLRRAGQLDGIDVDLNHDGTVDAHDIQRLDKATAALIYRVEWWDRYGYGHIGDPLLAIKVFNLAVNVGPGTAVRLFQQAINACDPHNQILVDGQLGPKTLAAANAADQHMLFGDLVQAAQDYYRHLVAIRPTLSKYLTGWLARAARV